MAKKRTYYTCETASCTYGEYETLEKAKKQCEDDGEVKRVIKVTEITEVVCTKPDYQISREEVLYQLHDSFEYDKKNRFLSKDAIKFLIDLLEKDKEISKNNTIFSKNATNGDIIKALFPDINVYDGRSGYAHPSDKSSVLLEHMSSDWWNAPYKGGDSE